MKLPDFLESALAGLASRGFSYFGKYRLELTPDDLRNLRISFSQFGEDLLIVEHLVNLRRPLRGIYVDAGCFDPVRFSNTRLLHLLGWKGVNVDASPAAVARFQVARPLDINILAALAGTVETNEFLQTASGASSRLAKGAVPLREGTEIRERSVVTTRTLRSVLDECLLSAEPVDLLDIDCEGIDFDVLKGFDLTARRPVIICIEAHGDAERRTLVDYLTGHHYGLIADRGPSLLFRDSTI